jgi:hypothetical protein
MSRADDPRCGATGRGEFRELGSVRKGVGDHGLEWTLVFVPGSQGYGAGIITGRGPLIREIVWSIRSLWKRTDDRPSADGRTSWLSVCRHP